MRFIRSATVQAIVLVFLAASRLDAQTTLEFDRIGLQQHRDYLRLQPFEQLDTQSGNVILTLTDLTLPGNAGHDVRFILTYNSNSDAEHSTTNPWRFGIPGVPMKVLQEQSYPSFTFANTLAGTADITPVLEMADGARYRTVFANPAPSWTNRATLYEVWTSQFWKYH